MNKSAVVASLTIAIAAAITVTGAVSAYADTPAPTAPPTFNTLPDHVIVNPNGTVTSAPLPPSTLHGAPAPAQVTVTAPSPAPSNPVMTGAPVHVPTPPTLGTQPLPVTPITLHPDVVHWEFYRAF